MPMQNKPPVLDWLTTDLVSLAQQGQLDPVAFRESEIVQLIEILCHTENNHAALIGERGVGRTTIVEGLAYRISDGNVPSALRNRHIHQLDAGGFIHFAQHHLIDKTAPRLIEDLHQSNSILFIDQIELFLGFELSDSQDFKQGFYTILEAAVEGHKFSCIIEMTALEFEQWQAVKPTLAVHFQTIDVFEPSVEEALFMVRAGKKPYEDHHGIKIPDNVIDSAVYLGATYILDRVLPNKAFDLIDEACSRRRMHKRRATERARQINYALARGAPRPDESPLTEEQRRELEKRKGDLLAELSALQPSLEAEAKEGYLTEDDIKEVIASWLQRPVESIDDAQAGE